ncbi:helix-turn-helix domain-containing protein [Frankia gtarii]|uniref:helix-turn-helix domain-containing protein n=1 Tax=Frankia gtarii TaxID=2950102 RepID=UPI0021C01684|nr:helix-turn-helix transcriptional regulator [Frankia gtarii]
MPDDVSASADAPDLDGVLRTIGPRLRALRQQLGATLPQLSALTRISVSTLSRLESGQRRPSLEHLLPLSRVYQVPLDALVNAPVVGDPRVHPRPITRSGMTFYPLSRRPGGLQAYKQIIPARWPGCEPKLQVHEGYEWLYVLSGRLRLLLGEHDIELVAGEVAEFDTHVPHAFANTGEKPVELLSLFGPQGERLHVRARPAGVPR